MAPTSLMVQSALVVLVIALQHRASAFSTVSLPRSSTSPASCSRLVCGPLSAAQGVIGTSDLRTGTAYFRDHMPLKKDNWFRNLKTIAQSRVLARVFKHVVFNVALAYAWCHLRADVLSGVNFPAGAHALAGAYLGLLITFRANSSYARFWEARHLWACIENTCRALAVNIQVWIKPQDAVAAQSAVNNLYRYPWAVMRQCRNEPFGEGDRPADVCQALQTDISNAALPSSWYGPISLYELELNEQSKNIDKLVDYTGALNRIIKTPLPLAYSRHGSRFLTMWCSTLPLAIGSKVGTPATLAVVALISWLMLGIDSIGQLLEAPFEQPKNNGEKFDYGLPVESLADSVAAEIARVSKIPHPGI